MTSETISDLFHSGGLLIRPSVRPQAIAELETGTIISLFEKHGVLIFRDFDLAPERVSSVTDRFTEVYAPDALRRATRFDQKVMHNVDHGNAAVPLHSEASFAASWPEIVWFYCVTPPSSGGCTTLCDGIKLWRGLSEGSRAAFLAQPLRYDVAIPIGDGQSRKGTEPWPSAVPGISGQLNWDEGIVSLTILRYAVHQTRMAGNLCCANHLLARGEPQIKSLSMADGSPLPSAALAELQSAADKLTFDVNWNAGDLAMIDNMRFMHGRRAYDPGVKRDIIQVQTQRASFAYGASTRRPRSAPAASPTNPATGRAETGR
jgi:alpha-ketoglutarate-dependent taurine dioxygenase